MSEITRTTDRNGNTIAVGTVVRSGDFPDAPGVSYVVGTVASLDDRLHSDPNCPAYRLERAIRIANFGSAWNPESQTTEAPAYETEILGDAVLAPVNGLLRLMGGKKTDFTAVADDSEREAYLWLVAQALPGDVFYGVAPEIGLRRGNMAVEWTNLGEGVDGDYDESDPDDVNLLRFDVYVLASDADSHRGEPTKDGVPLREAIDDASYCTDTPAGTGELALRGLLLRIMGAVHSADASLSNPPRIKRLCESLSWLSPEAVAAEGGR